MIGSLKIINKLPHTSSLASFSSFSYYYQNCYFFFYYYFPLLLFFFFSCLPSSSLGCDLSTEGFDSDCLTVELRPTRLVFPPSPPSPPSSSPS